MDTDLVRRAQGGDQEAFADLVYAIADRFLAVSHRILSDIDPAEDATRQAMLSVWQDLPQLRDPTRFEAWSYRLLVRACYAEGRGDGGEPERSRGPKRPEIEHLLLARRQESGAHYPLP
jgi:RNA polymerase sigma-70 factor (ECF subfamily)